MGNRQTAWQTIARGGCVRKAWKPSSSQPILIYFEFRSEPSLITVICMDPRWPNKLFATKYCFLILVDDMSFFIFLSFFFFFLFFLLFYVIIDFYKNHLIINFFSCKFFYIFLCSGMFRDFPECSGMFRNVPCSWFYRRPKGTGAAVKFFTQGVRKLWGHGFS